MKRLVFFVVLLICLDVSAQPKSESRFKLGYKLGASSAKITGGRVKGTSRITFQGGIWCQIKMDEHWTAQAEAIYIEKGLDGFFNRQPKIGEYAVSVMYIEFPVLFQYHKKRVTFEAGPGLGALIYQHEVLYGASMPNMTDTYPFTTKEFSFNLGCGYSLNDKWYLGLRFTHSLLPVRKQLPHITKPVYNRVFSLFFARTLNFKKSKSSESLE